MSAAEHLLGTYPDLVHVRGEALPHGHTRKRYMSAAQLFPVDVSVNGQTKSTVVNRHNVRCSDDAANSSRHACYPFMGISTIPEL